MVNSVGQVGLPPINANTLGYQGSMLPYVPIVTASRDPTGADINYPTGCEWSNGLTLDGWKLFGFVDGVAQWRTVNGGGGGSGIQSLSDDFGTKAFPDGMGDVQQFGSAGIKTLAGATSITFSLVGDGTASQYYNVDATTVPGVNPVVPDGGGNLNLTGGQVAPLAIGADVIQTHTYNPNSITFEIQQTDTAAAKDTTKNGVSHFNSSQFTADQGFISLVGGSVHPAFAGVDVDAHTAPGTDPVVADGSGIITVTGDQVAAGTCGPNVIRTDSLAANTITVEIQRTAAVAAPDSSNNGVSHFDSAFFNVDSAGFVQLATSTSGITSVEVDSFVGPGTNPVVPDIMGQITVNGLLAPAGTTPIQSISLAANEYAIEVQTSQQAPTTDVSKNGMSHFYNNDFLVDSNGFVTLKNPTGPTDLKYYNIDVIDDFAPIITNGDFWVVSLNGPYYTPTAIADHPGYIYFPSGSNFHSFYLGRTVNTSELTNSPGFALAPNGVSQIDFIHKFENDPQIGTTNGQWTMGYVPYRYNGTIGTANRFCCFTNSVNPLTTTVQLSALIGNTAVKTYTPLGVDLDQDWHKYTISIDSNVANTASFYLDDVFLLSITDPAITGMASNLGVSTLAFCPLICLWDLYRYQFTGYGARY